MAGRSAALALVLLIAVLIAVLASWLLGGTPHEPHPSAPADCGCDETGTEGGPPPPVYTRAPGTHRQIGVLVPKPGAAAGPLPPPLPLIGRRTHARSARWNYHTRSDQQVPMALPVFDVRGADCTKLAGCDEVYAGDEVDVPSYGRARVVMYAPESGLF